MTDRTYGELAGAVAASMIACLLIGSMCEVNGILFSASSERWKGHGYRGTSGKYRRMPLPTGDEVVERLREIAGLRRAGDMVDPREASE